MLGRRLPGAVGPPPQRMTGRLCETGMQRRALVPESGFACFGLLGVG
jgi:hypothetical protein